ncbi:MAG: hypothetical protein PUG10_09905 [Lachnospiraceae bacterium]|nr:hypothetical protein [Lachnospiraceae bacterium]
MNNVKLEKELYEPMRLWLEQYVRDKYKKYDVIAIDAHTERLDRVLAKYNIVNEMANGVDIQIDVLAIAKKNTDVKMFFIEAKKTQLTLRDLGQLWAYCKLVSPDEAYLFSSAGLGSLNKLLNVFRREDLLDFGDGKKIQKMKVAKWNIGTNAPDMMSMIPKI